MTHNRAELKINLEGIGRNFDRLKVLHGGKGMAVVKADAYGLGAETIASYLEDRADAFGVATVEEGIALRKKGIRKPVLVLGYVPEDGYSDLIFYDLETTVYDYETAKKLSSFSQERGIRCHIAVDTGMNRLGFRPEQTEELKKSLNLLSTSIRGIFTHYASVERIEIQSKIFNDIRSQCGIDDRKLLIHADNTDAVLNGIKTGNMFRTGIGLYGGNGAAYGLENVLEITAAVVQVKEIKKGESIGYSATYTAPEDGKYAVISCGYGDGYPVAFSNRSYVVIKGKKAFLKGRVCMDYFMVDVSDMDVRPGDRAVLFGKNIDANTVNDDFGGFFYEFLCNFALRAKREYF